MQRFLILAMSLAALGFQADAFANGAGSSVCEDGSPGGSGSSTHGSLGSGNGGYSLAFSPALPSTSTYAPGTQYDITLSGGDFVGFAISPLTLDTGDLTPGTNSKTLGACTGFSDGNGLTHRNSVTKSSATGTWTAPATGTASIRWTVLNQKSFSGTWFIDTVTLTAAAVPTAIPTVAPTSAPTAPTPAPTAAPTATPTAAPTIAPTTAPTPLPPGATFAPTPTPTDALTSAPTLAPTVAPTATPTAVPTLAPVSSHSVATVPAAVGLLLMTFSL